MSAKVAILQNNITRGGRLSVLARMIKNLGNNDIKPDLITGSLDFNLSDVEEWYNDKFSANLIDLKIYNRKISEYYLLRFNQKVQPLLANYDWVINSSNTAHFLHHPNLLDYVHYPRYRRILDHETFCNKQGLSQFVKWLEYLVVKRLYKQSNYPDCAIFTNSNYTKSQFERTYPDIQNVRVLYPPVQIPEKVPEVTRNRTVINLGRFHPSKKQLEIVQLAEKLPDFTFHLVGFATTNDPYLDLCKEYKTSHNLSNVYFHPNAPAADRDDLLRNSCFFLHLLHDEPFGISTVQGIAQGCIPIVPNSGGQTEIVNHDILRFNQVSEIPEILSSVAQFSTLGHSNLYFKLHKNIQQYSEISFDHHFNKLIQQYVG